MAELNIKIITDANQTIEQFKSVSTNVKAYRKDLAEANSIQEANQETLDKYLISLRKRMNLEAATKEGIAGLKAQSKLLREEIFYLNGEFGKGNKASLEFEKQLGMLQQEMKDVEKTSGGSLAKLTSVAKNILKFQLLMGPITAAVRGFKNTLSDSVKVAAEAEQVFNKLSTVFDGLTTSAKNAASAIAAELGVATSTAASALSTVGDLLQAQGMGTSASLTTSSEWAKQFQDIIAFKDINMSLEEFAQNFMSGAAGNLRNFRTFGSIVKESAVNAELAKKGMDKLTGSQLELAKMTTRAELALRQQANAMGATKREWETTLSINRRLSESWKEYKENLGSTLNEILVPMKSMWGSLLDQINKANKAQREFNSGNRNINVYDIYNNREDSATFQSSLSSAYNAYRENMSNAGQTIDGVVMGSEADALRAAISTVDSIIVKFGATVATVQHVMGDKLTPEMYKELRALEKIRVEENKRLAAIETRRGNIGATTDTYEAFTETLKAITGAGGISTPDWAFVSGQFAYAEGGDSVYAGNVANSMMKAVSDALESINNSDLAETWGDVISGALDDLDEKELREAQIESLRKLYEAAWNQFAEGGYTDEEVAKLEEIKKSYKQATNALDEYNKKIQIQNALLTANSTIASVISRTSRTKYEAGLNGPQSSNDLNMTLTWDIPLLIQDYAKALRDAGIALEDVRTETNNYRNALLKEASLKYQIAAKAERDEILGGYASSAEDYRQQRMNLGLSDAEVTRKKLMADYNQAVADEDNELITAISKTIMEFDLLQKATAELTLAQKLNPFFGLQESWKLGEAAGVGGIMGILADILSQTEAFSELTNIVSTTFVPIFNAIFKPLMPALSAVTSMFDALPWDVFFEVFKIVAEVIVAISTVIKVINAVIKNIFTAVHNILQRILHPITGGDQRPYESLEKIMNEANENLEKIKNSSFKIERNTENDDLMALRELYYNKVIDENQLYTGAKVLQKDIPFEALDNYAANVTYEITNNITINANDDAGMQKVERLLDENGIPLGYTFRGYFY